jgi:arginyl-tRNA synthetase
MQIRKELEEILKEIGVKAPFIELEVPRVNSHGDISTPVAMMIARQVKKPPREIAEQISKHLCCLSAYERVEVAGPGFINIFFKPEYLYEQLKKLLISPEETLRMNIGNGQSIQIEFVSANPTGPLHLGHGRGAAVGAALSNLLEKAGYSVEREFYINDAGRQVWLLGESVFARYCETFGVDYPFPEEGYRGEYIKEIANELKEEVAEEYINRRYDEVAEFFIDYGVNRMLQWIRRDLEEFGVFFDRWQSEKTLYNEGIVQKCHEELRKKGYLYDKDGAVWFRATEFGDDKDRVVIKSDGSPTYFASDIAYHWYKLQRGFDQLVNIWGADHHGYIPRIKAVIKALGQSEEKLHILLVQMVNLLRAGRPVQMSKRAGEFITLREVIEEVGSDITKFIFLTRRPDSHLDFDIEVAKKESSENPVYYVQYAYARINSIFRNAEEELLKDLEKSDLTLLRQDEELTLIKKTLFYMIMFEGAVRELEPHRVTFYLQELAKLFHSFYTKHRVLGNKTELSRARLALCKAVFMVLREGLSILGVTAPEKM